MKSILALALVAVLGSTSFAYEEKIDRSGGGVSAAMVSEPGPSALAGASGPVPGNFFAFRAEYGSDLSCDEFLARIHALISDWNNYPHANFYALSRCANSGNPKSRTEFLYALDAWRSDAVPSVQAFLRDHQGKRFEGKKLSFSPVTALDVKTVLSVGSVNANGSVSPTHWAESWSSCSGTDQWFPQNYARAKVVLQRDLDAFLGWVGKAFGASEQTAFAQAQAKAGYVGFGDTFLLHLANGEKADFWFGFGASRRCGGQACFEKNAPAGAPSVAGKPAFGELAREVTRAQLR